jgi:hypothetical protein
MGLCNQGLLNSGNPPMKRADSRGVPSAFHATAIYGAEGIRQGQDAPVNR